MASDEAVMLEWKWFRHCVICDVFPYFCTHGWRKTTGFQFRPCRVQVTGSWSSVRI